MDNVCFLEENCAKINSAVIKNRFISDTVEERIIICNKNLTNKDEIIHVLSDNLFLDGYDVVVFGKNVPENEADVVTIMMAQDMFVCGMVIKRKLFQKTGCFNEHLTALTDYEFLVRAAKSGSVFFVPVSTDDTEPDSDWNADMDESAKYETIAYLLRDNINLLKREGLLESVFTYFSKCAEKSRALNEFNNWTERYLDDTVLYEHTAKNTAPFLIISGDDTCHGVLKGFADELAGNLVKYGQAVITTDHKYGDMAEFTSGKHPFYKGVVGFQAPVLEDDVFRKLNSLKFQMWFDHPAFFNQLFKGLTSDYYILCQDMYYADYLKKYAHVENAIQFPPAGVDAGLSHNKNRKYDVVFIGTYCPVTVREMNEFEAGFAEYLLSHPYLTFESALEQLLEQYGLSFHEDEFKWYMCALHPVCRYVINYFRNKVVETILEAGIKLDVFGDTWKQYQGACAENLIIHPAVSVEESLEIWGHARIGLNVMTWHKGGMTERIANIMLSGAVCLSDETAYLRKYFKEDEEIVLFELNKLEELPEKIKTLLNNDSLRDRISQNAYKKASKEHSWKRRAKQLLELCE